MFGGEVGVVGQSDKDKGTEGKSYEDRLKELRWIDLEGTDEWSLFDFTKFKDIKHVSERFSDTFIFTEK